MKRFLSKLVKFSSIGLLILFLVFTSQMLWVHYHPFPNLTKLKKALNNDADIIIFGSSVNQHTDKNDTDLRAISSLLDTLLGKRKVISISHAAYHSEVYLKYVEYIAETDKRPVLIIPINLRYFSPEWDMRPNYQFLKERYELDGYPFIINFKNYKRISPTEFYSLPVFHKNKNIGSMSHILQNFKQSDHLDILKKGFILHYMQALPSSHRKLNALAKIAQVGKEKNIDVVMYLTPIDFSTANRLNIDGFNEITDQNIEVIKQRLGPYHLPVLDLSKTLPSSCFSYDKVPNEHLNMHGKLKVAQSLEKFLRFNHQSPTKNR